jgi:hypothetical protein
MIFLKMILAKIETADYIWAILKIEFGAHIGMMLLVCVNAALIRQGTKYQLGFRDALKVYLTKYIGPIVVGEVVVFATCWILPNLVGGSIVTGIEEHSTKWAKWVVWAVNNIRTSSLILGIVAQGIGFTVIRKGEKYFRAYEDEKTNNKSQNETE